VPEVEAPEIELDDDAPLFRRRLALVVVLITLFGAMVAYLHEQNSVREDNAARDAQIASIKGFGRQVDSSTQFSAEYRVFVQRQLLDRRRVVASGRLLTSGTDSALAALYTSDSERWQQLRDAIGKGNPVDSDQAAQQVDSQLQVDPDKARLQQEVFANRANDFGNKADAYVALLTVLAVGLFLIGLSLTVSGRGRYLLAFPGVGIALICVVWAVLITLRPVTSISDHAIDLTAQGAQLGASGDPDGASKAIDQFKQAIADSPGFGAAFARLADAEFEAGTPPTQNGTGFQSISDRDATKRAVAAGEKAISLGESGAALLSNIGFYHFTLGEYDRAEELSQQALANNADFPPLIFNLAVVQVAKGDAPGARASYADGIDKLSQESDRGLQFSILEAARTDLEIALTNTPSSKDLVQEMNGLLAVAEGKLLTTEAVPSGAPSGASVSDPTIDIDRSRLFATYTATGFDQNTPLSNIWYFRPLSSDGQGPFEQISVLDSATFTTGHEQSTDKAEFGSCLPGGDYRVEVYAGKDLVASKDQHIEDSPLGALVVDPKNDDLGFTLCHPDTWKPLDTGEPGSLAFQNPDDPTQSVLVFSFPLGAGVDANEATTSTIDSIVASEQLTNVSAPLVGTELLGRALRAQSDGTLGNLDVDLNTTAVSGQTPTGEQVAITMSVGSDGVIRAVVVTAANLADLNIVRGELVSSARFLRVPDTTSP
jgi:tetratricopeptide (TPR) repeat protein